MFAIGSLFSGVGGLERGLEFCGLGPVAWQCEKDPYAYNVLACRYPSARRYRDVRSIKDAGPDRPPDVDVICGGFPCQDVSVAGKGAGLEGKRSGLWAEFARVVGILRPRIVFVENVAALRGRGLDRVLGDLAALGFDAEWGCYRALDVGAPHIRERLFVLAYADRHALRQFAERLQQRSALGGVAVAGSHGGGFLGDAHGSAGSEPDGSAGAIDDEREGARPAPRGAGATGGDGGGVAHAEGERLEGEGEGLSGQRGGERCDVMAHAHGRGRGGERSEEPRRLEGAPGGEPDGRRADRDVHRFPPGPSRIAEWAGAEPAVRRGDDGTSRRVDRLRCLGNAVVPQQAALAFSELLARALGDEAPAPPPPPIPPGAEFIRSVGVAVDTEGRRAEVSPGAAAAMLAVMVKGPTAFVRRPPPKRKRLTVLDADGNHLELPEET